VSSTRRRVLPVRNNEKNMIVMMWSLEREKSEQREGENMRGFERICSFVE
jgi:hypothetical protein